MDIGAALIDVFMILVIAIGVAMVAAMVREQIPRRRATQVSARSAVASDYGPARISVNPRRTA